MLAPAHPASWRRMQTETVALIGDSPGTRRAVTVLRFGAPGARPKVYLQAGLHADEAPGMLVLHHLSQLLQAAQARILGEVVLVPAANPIGLSHWISHKPLGRQDPDSMQNFNRLYPDLAALVGDELEALLTETASENLQIIRAAFGRALARAEGRNDLDDLRLTLMRLSHDADYVLDLHCDHVGILYLYASPAHPQITSQLCRSIGAKVALIAEVSGGNAFDEAHTAPWALLQRRFGAKFPIPHGCFGSTVEYRGQFDVSDSLAAADAANLMGFLATMGAVSGGAAPAFEDAQHFPLGGMLQTRAPTGGVVSWIEEPGGNVRKGQVLGHVTDPTTGQRAEINAACDGIFVRRELWPTCLRGHELCDVAGAVALQPPRLSD